MSGDALTAPLTGLYTRGDLGALRGHLLHSTAWKQHLHTAYGEEMISRSWMSWLSACGLSTSGECEQVSGSGQSLHLFRMMPSRGQSEVRLALWSWNNGEYIKRMYCQVDTGLMSSSLGKDARQLSDALPKADPLMLCDYDQQEHPHSVDVSPGQLAYIPEALQEPLQGWWSLWQDMQLSNIARWYADDARIELPGIPGLSSPDQLLQYCSDWFVRQERRFCQPESVIVNSEDLSRVAVLWHMEGDMQGRQGIQRVRVPVINLLNIQDGLVQADSMVLDSIALEKQLSA